jgi:alginate O-acetyltransferase complex protein AlgJ
MAELQDFGPEEVLELTVAAAPALPAVHEAWLPREHALHRPRHGGRQLVALICAAVFFATPLVALGLGVRPAVIENRPLTAFPSLGDGWGFFSSLSPWATDHLVFRQQAIDVADAISRGLFGEPPPFSAGKQGPGLPGPIPGDPNRGKPDILVPTVIEGKDGWLYLGEDVRSRCKQVSALAVTFGQLRRLREGIEASGRKFMVVVAPDKTTMVPQYLPDTYPGKDCQRGVTEELWRRAGEERSVLDLRGELRAWGDLLGKPVYPRQDAHWADEGGIVMARGMAETLHPGITRDWKIDPAEDWRAPADLPPLIGHYGDAEGRYYTIRPDGVRAQTRAVPQDFNRPLQLNTASGPGTVPEKVGLIADSFTIRALRYLGASFRDITVLHYGQVPQDRGRAAAEMLIDKKVVVFEIVERMLSLGDNILLDPAVIDEILRVLAEHPVP